MTEQQVEERGHSFFFPDPEFHGDEQPERSDHDLHRLSFGRRALVATALLALVACFVCVAVFVAMGLNPSAQHGDMLSTSALTAAGEEAAEALDLELLDLHPQPVQEFEEEELDEAEGVWINRDPHAGLNITREPSHLSSSSGSARRLGGGSNCKAGLEHLQQLGTQHLVAGAQDTLFPATMSSIAPPGANCGDSAAGIHESCSKYNNWRTFQEVADAMGKKFEVIASGGPNWHDVGQGELGNCYFLAALASMANSDPQVIEGMFVNREKWAQNIYTTKWLINGKETTVEVDNHLPSRPSRPYFVKPSDAGEWWPVILEKAWSKIFSTYYASEGGIWANAAIGMSAAPLKQLYHDETSTSELFAELQKAGTNGWPMGAGTAPNCKKYGLVSGHAYAVFKASVMGGHGNVVQVYNPWGKDGYHGAVPNTDEHDGIFTMTVAEYRDAFRSTVIARVKNSYKTTSTLIQSKRRASTAWKFHVGTSDRFWVSVRWPANRLMKPCDLPNPSVTLAVVKAGSTDDPALGERAVIGISTFTAEVNSGPGDYTAVVAVDFMDSEHQREAHLVVYAKESVAVSKSPEDPADTMMRVFGPTSKGQPCHIIFIPGRGNLLLKKDELVNGVPTLWSSTGSEFAYWAPRQGKWLMITSSHLAKVRAGEVWSFAKFTKDKMSCGCHDDPHGVSGFKDLFCNHVKAPPRFRNVACKNSEHSELVQHHCPVTCGAEFCKQSIAPTPAPPPPAPPSSSQPTTRCSDRSNPKIKVDGVHRQCPALKEFCEDYDLVRKRCCETCVKQAEGGGVSNDLDCKDHNPPNLRDGSTRFTHCSQLTSRCHGSRLVRGRCCATCKRSSGSVAEE